MPGQLLAMNPGTADAPLDGIATTEPAFGLPGRLDRRRPSASRPRSRGYTVVDPTSVVATHLSRDHPPHADELLRPPGRPRAARQPQGALPGGRRGAGARPHDRRRGAARAPAPAREGVSIRDLVTILETLGDKAKLTKDVPILTEYCRQALARAICGRFVDEVGTLRAITLDPEVDREIAESVTRTEDGADRQHGPGPRCGASSTALREQAEVAQADRRPAGGALLGRHPPPPQGPHRPRHAQPDRPLVPRDPALRARRARRARRSVVLTRRPIAMQIKQFTGASIDEVLAADPRGARRGRA